MVSRPWWLRRPPEAQRRHWAAEGRCPRCGSREFRRFGPERGTGEHARRDPAARPPGGFVEGGGYEPGFGPNASCLRCGFRFRTIG